MSFIQMVIEMDRANRPKAQQVFLIARFWALKHCRLTIGNSLGSLAMRND